MSKLPVCFVIYLTDYCSLHCKHCFLTQTKTINNNMIDFKVLKKLLKTLKENNVFMIAYTGGDPMLHPKIFDILNYTSELGMLPLLGISGINVSNDISKKIYDSGVRCVQIGLNGSNEKINDFYRGKGSYTKIIESINNLKNNNINVNVAFCIDKNNYNDVDNMLELANKLSIYKVKIEFWNCLNKSNNYNLLELDENEKDIIRKKCDLFMRENNKDNWIQYPKSNTNLTKIHTNALVIMPNGDVKKNEMSKSLGNIYKNEIMKIVEDK